MGPQRHTFCCISAVFLHFQFTLKSNFIKAILFSSGSQNTPSLYSCSCQMLGPIVAPPAKVCPPLDQLQRKATSDDEEAVSSRKTTGWGGRWLRLPLDFVFFFFSLQYIYFGLRAFALAKDKTKWQQNKRLKLPSSKSKTLNYLSCHKSLSCVDTTDHFHNVNADIFSGDRHVGPADCHRLRRIPWIPGLSFCFYGNLSFFAELRGDVCSLQAGGRPPACMAGQPGGLRLTDAVKNTCALARFHPTPPPSPTPFCFTFPERQF